jgi:hypothetical protein
MNSNDIIVEEKRRRYGHLLKMLKGHGFVWHCTSPGAFYSIVEGGAILPSGVAPTEWQSSLGRKFAAVSLFNFDSTSDEDAPFYRGACDDWTNWFGLSINHVARICIAIAVDRLDSRMLFSIDEACQALGITDKWKHKHIPMIESLHKGPILASAFAKIYVAKGGTLDHIEVPLDGNLISTVKELVSKWTEEGEREAAKPREIDLRKILSQY